MINYSGPKSQYPGDSDQYIGVVNHSLRHIKLYELSSLKGLLNNSNTFRVIEVCRFFGASRQNIGKKTEKQIS